MCRFSFARHHVFDVMWMADHTSAGCCRNRRCLRCRKKKSSLDRAFLWGCWFWTGFRRIATRRLTVCAMRSPWWITFSSRLWSWLSLSAQISIFRWVVEDIVGCSLFRQFCSLRSTTRPQFECMWAERRFRDCSGPFWCTFWDRPLWKSLACAFCSALRRRQRSSPGSTRIWWLLSTSPSCCTWLSDFAWLCIPSRIRAITESTERLSLVGNANGLWCRYESKSRRRRSYASRAAHNQPSEPAVHSHSNRGSV